MILGGLYLEGLIHGEAYFQNFTVFLEGDLTKLAMQAFYFSQCTQCTHHVINTVTSDNKILLIKALCPERQEY